jgi:hypothetical protein
MLQSHDAMYVYDSSAFVCYVGNNECPSSLVLPCTLHHHATWCGLVEVEWAEGEGARVRRTPSKRTSRSARASRTSNRSSAIRISCCSHATLVDIIRPDERATRPAPQRPYVAEHSLVDRWNARDVSRPNAEAAQRRGAATFNVVSATDNGNTDGEGVQACSSWQRLLRGWFGGVTQPSPTHEALSGVPSAAQEVGCDEGDPTRIADV